MCHSATGHTILGGRRARRSSEELRNHWDKKKVLLWRGSTSYLKRKQKRRQRNPLPIIWRNPMKNFSFPSPMTPELPEQDQSRGQQKAQFHATSSLRCGGHHHKMSLKLKTLLASGDNCKWDVYEYPELLLTPWARHTCYILELLYRAVLEMLCTDLQAAKF